MIDDDRLLYDFHRNTMDFFAATALQRQEILRSYEYRDCHQWSAKDLKERDRLDKTSTIINMAAPLIRAVSGTEVLQDKKLDYVALDDALESDADAIGDAVSYAQYVSGYDAEQSTAREDAATCGIGATVTWLDMSIRGAIAGRPVVERVFPGFLFYDNSSRGVRLNERARWCGYADPVNSDELDDRIMRMDGKKPVYSFASGQSSGGDLSGYLSPFVQMARLTKIDFIYNYFWWEYEDIYDITNPFADEKSILAQIVGMDDDAANVIGEAAQSIRIDWQAPAWSLTPEGYKDLQNALEVIEGITGVEVVKLNMSKRRGKCYYKAQIARGAVLEKSRCYTQNGFPLNFIPGYYDETQNIFYGMMRPLSYVQDALNVSLSDFLGYVKSAAHGGGAWITGPVDALESIKRTRANEDSITPLPLNTQVTPKALPSTPQALVEFIRLMMEIMPRALGLGQEFLGIITSGDMTDALYGKVMRQSYAVLANFANNSASYSRRQGEIFVDIVRLMADVEDGKSLPIIDTEPGGDRTFRLYRQNLASEYMVRIVERPMSADERQDTFNKLAELVPQYLQAGINIMPILSRYAPLDAKDRTELVQLSSPQPQQPDPANQALVQSQINLGNAQAEKLVAEAASIRAALPYAEEKVESEIYKNNATAVKAYAESGANTGELSLSQIAEMLHDQQLEASRQESNERIAHNTALISAAQKTAQMQAQTNQSAG